jgi:hypothetical protein
MVRLSLKEHLSRAAKVICSTVIITWLCSSATTSARDFYVSPDGGPNGNGKLRKPWDLDTALNRPPKVKPGDTIWLRGGVYSGTATSGFKCFLSGTPDAPITIRNYPGERAIIDRGGTDPKEHAAMELCGPHVIIWGLEITNSYPDRNRISPYTVTVHSWRGPGLFINAPHCKVINCIIHDNNTGIYDKEDGTEIYGCLLYYNGNNGFGHGLYIGNNLGTKLIAENLIFDNAGLGIQSYSANTSSQQKGIRIEGNASFNNGAITLDDQNSTNILIGAETGVSAERISVVSNYIYAPASAASNKSKGLRLGQVDRNNKDAVVTDNYIACKVPLTVQWWERVQLQRNTLYTPMTSINLQTKSGESPSGFMWNSNVFVCGRGNGLAFTYNSSSGIDLSSWRSITGLDSESQMIKTPALRPTGVKTVIRPNKYEAGRGHIIVFNWELDGWVDVDVSSLGLQIEDEYEVRDAQNYFEPPVARGTYKGKSIRLPMDLKHIANPSGNVERMPTHTAPQFAAFVIQKV